MKFLKKIWCLVKSLFTFKKSKVKPEVKPEFKPDFDISDLLDPKIDKTNHRVFTAEDVKKSIKDSQNTDRLMTQEEFDRGMASDKD